MGSPLEYLNLKWKGKSKAWGILCRPEIRVAVDKYLQMKVYICCKRLLNGILIQKSASETKDIHLITRGDHRKTIKIMKALRDKYE